MEFINIPIDFVNELTKSVIALFVVVVDPIGNVPIFINLTSRMDKVQKKKTATVARFTDVSLLILFAFAGTQILSLFAINIYSFMIAGGILLFNLSIELLTHGTLRYNKEDSVEDNGVVPLAFPTS